MVTITIICEDEKMAGFKAEGHAGLAPEGEDICCAGVSAITQTALLGLLNHLSQKPIYSMEKGWIHCKLAKGLTEKDQNKAQLILSTMEMGLLSLEEAYPKYIKVHTRRC